MRDYSLALYLVHSKCSINATCYFYYLVASSLFTSNFVFPFRKGKFWSYYALANILQQLPFNSRIKGIFLGMAYQNLNDPTLLVKCVVLSLPSMLHLGTLFFSDFIFWNSPTWTFTKAILKKTCISTNTLCSNTYILVNVFPLPKRFHLST